MILLTPFVLLNTITFGTFGWAVGIALFGNTVEAVGVMFIGLILTIGILRYAGM